MIQSLSIPVIWITTLQQNIWTITQKLWSCGANDDVQDIIDGMTRELLNLCNYCPRTLVRKYLHFKSIWYKIYIYIIYIYIIYKILTFWDLLSNNRSSEPKMNLFSDLCMRHKTIKCQILVSDIFGILISEKREHCQMRLIPMRCLMKSVCICR